MTELIACPIFCEYFLAFTSPYTHRAGFCHGFGYILLISAIHTQIMPYTDCFRVYNLQSSILYPEIAICCCNYGYSWQAYATYTHRRIKFQLIWVSNPEIHEKYLRAVHKPHRNIKIPIHDNFSVLSRC